MAKKARGKTRTSKTTTSRKKARSAKAAKRKGKKVKSLTKSQLSRLKVGPRMGMRPVMRDKCVCTTDGGDSGITKTTVSK